MCFYQLDTLAENNTRATASQHLVLRAGAPGNRTRTCAGYQTGSRHHRSAPAAIHPANGYERQVQSDTSKGRRRGCANPPPMTEAEPRVAMDEITALAKRRGFIFQSSEIYGGIGGFYE